MKNTALKYILLFCININVNLLYGQIITTIAGGATGHGGYWGDGGPATAAAIGGFGSIAIDSHGNIYIADGNNDRIRKVDATTGIITTVAGNGIAGYNGDGILATAAKLNLPGGVSVDYSDNFYITDINNYRIRKVDVTTGIISTFAGNGVHGYVGDGSPATVAQIYADGFTCWDTFGNMYLGDGRKIRKINPLGIITTVAGTGLPGITGEGVPATSTNIHPEGIGTDALGNVYIADTTRAIRKVTISTGLITRISGMGDNINTPYCGDSSVATSCHIGPLGIAVDPTGNVYIADEANSIVEKVDVFGIIHTIAGNQTFTHSGDGGPATAAGVNWPEGVALDSCGNVYIAEFGSRVVRKVTFDTSCHPHGEGSLGNNIINKDITKLNVYPNPANNTLFIVGADRISEVIISNLLGQTLISKEFNSEQVQMNIESLPAGVYVVKVRGNEGRVMIGKFLKE